MHRRSQFLSTSLAYSWNNFVSGVFESDTSLVTIMRMAFSEAMTDNTGNNPNCPETIKCWGPEVYACLSTLKLNLSGLISISNMAVVHNSIFSFLSFLLGLQWLFPIRIKTVWTIITEEIDLFNTDDTDVFSVCNDIHKTENRRKLSHRYCHLHRGFVEGSVILSVYDSISQSIVLVFPVTVIQRYIIS